MYDPNVTLDVEGNGKVLKEYLESKIMQKSYLNKNSEIAFLAN